MASRNPILADVQRLLLAAERAGLAADCCTEQIEIFLMTRQRGWTAGSMAWGVHLVRHSLSLSPEQRRDLLSLP